MEAKGSNVGSSGTPDFSILRGWAHLEWSRPLVDHTSL